MSACILPWGVGAGMRCPRTVRLHRPVEVCRLRKVQQLHRLGADTRFSQSFQRMLLMSGRTTKRLVLLRIQKRRKVCDVRVVADLLTLHPAFKLTYALTTIDGFDFMFCFALVMAPYTAVVVGGTGQTGRHVVKLV